MALPQILTLRDRGSRALRVAIADYFLAAFASVTRIAECRSTSQGVARPGGGAMGQLPPPTATTGQGSGS
jgi:hypothetical protein